MSKRPLDEGLQPAPKKICASAESLQQMKTQIDNMLKQPKDHHEEIRLAAVDHAYEKEEQWKEASAQKDDIKEELDTVSTDLSTAETYLSEFESNPAVKMLEKASTCGVERAQVLMEDHEKIMDTLTKLRHMKETLSNQNEMLTQKYSDACAKCEDFKKTFDNAESTAEIISGLNE